METYAWSLDVSGNIRRFRRVCEHIQSQVCSRNVGINLGGQSRAAPPSPRASRKFATEMSESSSCGSDTSERLFLSPHPATRQVVCFNKVVPSSPSSSSIHCATLQDDLWLEKLLDKFERGSSRFERDATRARTTLENRVIISTSLPFTKVRIWIF